MNPYLLNIIVLLCGVSAAEYLIYKPRTSSESSCQLILVESIPENLTFDSQFPVHNSTYQGWKTLLKLVKQQLNIASFYWTLKSDDLHIEAPSAWEGEDIFNDFMDLLTKRQLTLNITQSLPTKSNPNFDTPILLQYGAQVTDLDMPKLVGNGVLHTKFWVVDGMHFYLGSANMDFRSLTQVKELGVFASECSALASDLQKIYDIYWYAGSTGKIPQPWPEQFSTTYNIQNPLNLMLNNIPAKVFLTSSPKQFCAKGRTDDLEALLHVIKSARKFVHIAVMDYEPALVFAPHFTFWPVIDDALRSAALTRHVEVRLLASLWNHTSPDMLKFLNSLSQLNGIRKSSIEVKLFEVPASAEQAQIPFSRVNHNKYMVTDNVAFIGTSNWSGDYFTNTAGVSVVINETTPDGNLPAGAITSQLQQVFVRDWTSPYAQPLQLALVERCTKTKCN